MMPVNMPPVKARYLEQRKIKMFDALRMRSSYTNDVESLKKTYTSGLIPVFVYDQLMKGHTEAFWLDKFPYFGPATTLGDEFILMNSGEKVILFNEEFELKEQEHLIPSNFKRVQGDLYGVPLTAIYQLDKGFTNTIGWDRSPIDIQLHLAQGNNVIVQKAQTYCGDYEFWKVASRKNVASKLTICPQIFSRFRLERVYRAWVNDPVARAGLPQMVRNVPRMVDSIGRPIGDPAMRDLISDDELWEYGIG